MSQSLNAEKPPGKNTPGVLIVDDHPENLLALNGLLDDMELDIVKANSGNEALGVMLEQDFALVLLDVQMPGMDGYEVAELMRKNEKTKHIPIVFVTAINSEEQHVFKGYESGALDYLFKPIAPEILRSKVAVFVNLYRKHTIIQQQLEQIKTLRGLLPICSHCKKIRDDTGYWETIEVYVRDHSDAEFTHGICPDCVETHYPELAEEEPRERKSSEGPHDWGTPDMKKLPEYI